MSSTKRPSAKLYEQAWAQNCALCSECHALNPLAEVTLLSFNTCRKCKKSYFAAKKVGSSFLYEPAGGGGMGSVYKAVSEDFPNRLLAVKLLSREERNNPINVMSLLNEARVSALFRDSQFVAACLDAGFSNDEYYTTMDFIVGERLDKMIERLGHLPPKDVLLITKHILAAEQHIYRKGYLFRDLKPENIIISPKGYAILLDFGLCIPREQAQEAADEYVSGSPYYIPPERLLGNPEDIRSEIYSLGMVMYFALQGKTYFDAAEADTLAKRHLSNLRLSNEAKMQGLHPALGELVAHMISQSPEARPASFIEIFKAIDDLAKAI